MPRMQRSVCPHQVAGADREPLADRCRHPPRGPAPWSRSSRPPGAQIVGGRDLGECPPSEGGRALFLASTTIAPRIVPGRTAARSAREYRTMPSLKLGRWSATSRRSSMSGAKPPNRCLVGVTARAPRGWRGRHGRCRRTWAGTTRSPPSLVRVPAPRGLRARPDEPGPADSTARSGRTGSEPGEQPSRRGSPRAAGVGEPVVEEVDPGLQTAVGGERVGRRRRRRLTVTGQPLDHRRCGGGGLAGEADGEPLGRVGTRLGLDPRGSGTCLRRKEPGLAERRRGGRAQGR